jgi:spoIIIJ-associated protein
MQKREIETTGADVEAAIANGLAKLGVARADATIEILDEGSKGILGLGRRDARVRLTAMIAPAPPVEKEAPKWTPAPAVEPEPVVETPVVEEVPAEMPAFSPALTETVDPPATEATAAPKRPVAEPVDDEEEVQAELEVAVDIWSTLLEKLTVEADIQTKISEPDDITGRRVPKLNIDGKDLSPLIGPRGDTLNAMQYITRLMAAHRLKSRANFIVDVAGYRERRKQALERLAERMANKATRRGKALTLEPMPANERRAIHVALRDHADVFTQSTGEGSGRRVKILLKK